MKQKRFYAATWVLFCCTKFEGYRFGIEIGEAQNRKVIFLTIIGISYEVLVLELQILSQIKIWKESIKNCDFQRQGLAAGQTNTKFMGICVNWQHWIQNVATAAGMLK